MMESLYHSGSLSMSPVPIRDRRFYLGQPEEESAQLVCALHKIVRRRFRRVAYSDGDATIRGREQIFVGGVVTRTNDQIAWFLARRADVSHRRPLVRINARKHFSHHLPFAYAEELPVDELTQCHKDRLPRSRRPPEVNTEAEILVLDFDAFDRQQSCLQCSPQRAGHRAQSNRFEINELNPGAVNLKTVIARENYRRHSGAP